MLLESKLERLAFWGHLRGGLGTLVGCYGTEIGPTPRIFTWFYGFFFCVALAPHHLGPHPSAYRDPNSNWVVLEAHLASGAS